MYSFIIFAVTLCTCYASDVAVSPPQVYCGDIPTTLYSCLGNPRFINPEAPPTCKDTSECGKIKCILTMNGWLKDGKVDKQQLVAHFDQFAEEHPAWTAAVQHAKATCLVPHLPPQGIYLDCPAYDIMHCSLSSFVKNAQASQWSVVPQCQYPKQFATSCPMCPTDCFAPRVPYGSCNACLTLPRSP